MSAADNPTADHGTMASSQKRMITRNGIDFMENLDLEGLAADTAYEFAFIFAPHRLNGANGSPGNPIAVS